MTYTTAVLENILFVISCSGVPKRNGKVVISIEAQLSLQCSDTVCQATGRASGL